MHKPIQTTPRKRKAPTHQNVDRGDHDVIIHQSYSMTQSAPSDLTSANSQIKIRPNLRQIKSLDDMLISSYRASLSHHTYATNIPDANEAPDKLPNETITPDATKTEDKRTLYISPKNIDDNNNDVVQDYGNRIDEGFSEKPQPVFTVDAFYSRSNQPQVKKKWYQSPPRANERHRKLFHSSHCHHMGNRPGHAVHVSEGGNSRVSTSGNVSKEAMYFAPGSDPQGSVNSVPHTEPGQLIHSVKPNRLNGRNESPSRNASAPEEFYNLSSGSHPTEIIPHEQIKFENNQHYFKTEHHCGTKDLHNQSPRDCPLNQRRISGNLQEARKTLQNVLHSQELPNTSHQPFQHNPTLETAKKLRVAVPEFNVPLSSCTQSAPDVRKLYPQKLSTPPEAMFQKCQLNSPSKCNVVFEDGFIVNTCVRDLPTHGKDIGMLLSGLAYRWNFTDNRYADIDLS